MKRSYLISELKRCGYLLLFIVLSSVHVPIVYATPSETIRYKHKSTNGVLEYTQKTYYPDKLNTRLRKIWRKFHFQLADHVYESFKQHGEDLDAFKLDWHDETSTEFYKRLVKKLSSDSDVMKILINQPLLRKPYQFIKKHSLRDQVMETKEISVQRVFDGEKLLLKVVRPAGNCRLSYKIETFEDMPVNFNRSNSGKYLAYQLKNRVEFIDVTRCTGDRNSWMNNLSYRSINLGHGQSQSLGAPFDIYWIDQKDNFYALLYSMSARADGQLIYTATKSDTYFIGPLVEWGGGQLQSLKLDRNEEGMPVISAKMKGKNQVYKTRIPASFEEQVSSAFKKRTERAENLMKKAKRLVRDETEEDMRKALELVKKAVQVDPNNWKAHEMLAETYEYFGGYQEEIDTHLWKAASIEGAPLLELLREIKRNGSPSAKNKARRLINDENNR